MGCFLRCFGSSKHKKQHTHNNLQRNASSKPEQPSVSSVQDYSKTLLSPSIPIPDKTEEQQQHELSVETKKVVTEEQQQHELSVGTRKKVTFDSNVKTYEPVLADEAADFPPEKKSEEVGKEKTSDHSKSSSSEDSSVTSTGSYPPNHRYQNCRDSDDEDEVLDDWDSDLSDEECDEFGDDFEEVNDDGDRVFAEEVESPVPTFESDVKTIGSNNPNARDRSAYVHPVLNPVENLTQWKAVKAQRKPPLSPRKENFVFSNHDSHKELSETDTPKMNREIPVDASLSNWLGSSETTPVNKAGLYAGTPDRTASQGSNSAISHEDRPILGALTVEELKQFSATSSPRKSPCRSPDEMPIIGTVGTFWSSTGSADDFGSVSSFKGIPNTTSKYREDKKVSWHSTPFEARLEKALNRGAAEAASTVPHVF